MVDMQVHLKNLKIKKSVFFFTRVSRVFLCDVGVRYLKADSKKLSSKALFLADYKIFVDFPRKSTLNEKKEKCYGTNWVHSP